MNTESTRLRFGLILIGVIAIEGIITAFFGKFPFSLAASIQAGVYATYVTGRTVTDYKELGNGGS